MKKQDLEKIAETLGGLLVLGCLPGSPTAEAGLRYGDILLSVNGKPVPDWLAYITVTRDRPSVHRLRIFRDGTEVEFTITLPEEPPAPATRALVRSLVKSGSLAKDLEGLEEPLAPLKN